LKVSRFLLKTGTGFYFHPFIFAKQKNTKGTKNMGGKSKQKIETETNKMACFNSIGFLFAINYVLTSLNIDFNHQNSPASIMLQGCFNFISL